MTSITIVLNAIESGHAQTQDLLPLVYDELRGTHRRRGGTGTEYFPRHGLSLVDVFESMVGAGW